MSSTRGRRCNVQYCSGVNVKFLGGSTIKVNRTVGKPEEFYYVVEIKKRIDDFERLLKPIFGERLTVK